MAEAKRVQSLDVQTVPLAVFLPAANDCGRSLVTVWRPGGSLFRGHFCVFMEILWASLIQFSPFPKPERSFFETHTQTWSSSWLSAQMLGHSLSPRPCRSTPRPVSVTSDLGPLSLHIPVLLRVFLFPRWAPLDLTTGLNIRCCLWLRPFHLTLSLIFQTSTRYFLLSIFPDPTSTPA